MDFESNMLYVRQNHTTLHAFIQRNLVLIIIVYKTNFPFEMKSPCNIFDTAIIIRCHLFRLCRYLQSSASNPAPNNNTNARSTHTIGKLANLFRVSSLLRTAVSCMHATNAPFRPIIRMIIKRRHFCHVNRITTIFTSWCFVSSYRIHRTLSPYVPLPLGCS
jgi:hypothetical protein